MRVLRERVRLEDEGFGGTKKCWGGDLSILLIEDESRGICISWGVFHILYVCFCLTSRKYRGIILYITKNASSYSQSSRYMICHRREPE